MTVTKKSILEITNYGLNIYSHILRLYYPDEVVIKLVGRDCGLCRNPFNANKNTLHIFIEKENILGNSLDREFAKHTDSENAIPAGDAFGFAELHYKQQGDELLQTLNRELKLRIGEKQNFYKKNYQKPNQENPTNQSSDNLFSFFKAPISNTKPHKAVRLLDIYNYIVGKYAKERTEKLQALLVETGGRPSKSARHFKAANFDYCTFSGVFTTRNDKALVKHSGLLCLYFDHLKDVQKLRFQLLQDEYFETQLLFVSPSGNGLKWIIQVNITQATHADYFLSVANYLKATYNIEVDKSGKDISRACFLPHDPQAFINPKLV